MVTQWGCWNTYFVTPKYNTLGDKFLLSGEQGAAAVLGAATLSFTESERELATRVFSRLFQSGMTLGEAVQQAKAELARVNPNLLDVLIGWTLLGDPLIRLQP